MKQVEVRFPHPLESSHDCLVDKRFTHTCTLQRDVIVTYYYHYRYYCERACTCACDFSSKIDIEIVTSTRGGGKGNRNNKLVRDERIFFHSAQPDSFTITLTIRCTVPEPRKADLIGTPST